MKVFVLSIMLLMSSTSGQLIKNADNDKSPRHHEPRHDDDQDEKTTVGENITTDESLEENTEVRHHIYMPYPLAYRQSAHPPTIQYVPHYRAQHHSALPVPAPAQFARQPVQYVPVTVDQFPRYLSPAGAVDQIPRFVSPAGYPHPVDPRFISLNLGTYADLGFASVGANTALDGNRGQFSAGAGVGTGSNYATYGQYGVTKLPQSSTGASTYSTYTTTSPDGYPVTQSRAAVVPQPPQVVPQVAAAPRHHPHFAPVLRPQPVNYAVGNQAARAATAPTVFYPIYL